MTKQSEPIKQIKRDKKFWKKNLKYSNLLHNKQNPKRLGILIRLFCLVTKDKNVNNNDNSTLPIFSHLSHGGSIILVTDSETKDNELMHWLITGEKIENAENIFKKKKYTSQKHFLSHWLKTYFQEFVNFINFARAPVDIKDNAYKNIIDSMKEIENIQRAKEPILFPRTSTHQVKYDENNKPVEKKVGFFKNIFNFSGKKYGENYGLNLPLNGGEADGTNGHMLIYKRKTNDKEGKPKFVTLIKIEGSAPEQVSKLTNRPHKAYLPKPLFLNATATLLNIINPITLPKNIISNVSMCKSKKEMPKAILKAFIAPWVPAYRYINQILRSLDDSIFNPKKNKISITGGHQLLKKAKKNNQWNNYSTTNDKKGYPSKLMIIKNPETTKFISQNITSKAEKKKNAKNQTTSKTKYPLLRECIKLKPHLDMLFPHNKHLNISEEHNKKDREQKEAKSISREVNKIINSEIQKFRRKK